MLPASFLRTLTALPGGSGSSYPIATTQKPPLGLKMPNKRDPSLQKGSLLTEGIFTYLLLRFVRNLNEFSKHGCRQIRVTIQHPRGVREFSLE